jgi:hypothetical protein
VTTAPDGNRISSDARIAELRARRGAGDPAVRALAGNGKERAAGVHRTEDVLRGWLWSSSPVADEDTGSRGDHGGGAPVAMTPVADGTGPGTDS